ncbi:MerR-like DNA binding protein [Micromonospora pisi]|uniref:MerR-like DNA binding protein n=1 Tax=Micromonospora pisi TaxID=589240 RepID=A0A495JD83_9ACTN|nr:MerR family transcriptional regulator [Micromonospora pisi]RKR86877.1 MerR-like DNA binding protein [Micromonospora pisi]
MRISDLSRVSGVPVATIKFYLREGLLEPGRLTARNQARYDESHLARLRLIRMLTGIGQLSLSSVHEVVAAVDNKGLSTQGLCRALNRALFTEPPPAAELSAGGSVSDQVDEFIEGLGWTVEVGSPGRQTLAQVLIAMRRLRRTADVDIFEPLAKAAEQLAAYETDLAYARDADDTVDRATVVAQTVLLEAAFAAMRRMAHDHHLGTRKP